MFGACINGFGMAAVLTYTGETLCGGDLTQLGLIPKEKSGSLHCLDGGQNLGGGYQYYTKAK